MKDKINNELDNNENNKIFESINHKILETNINSKENTYNNENKIQNPKSDIIIQINAEKENNNISNAHKDNINDNINKNNNIRERIISPIKTNKIYQKKFQYINQYFNHGNNTYYDYEIKNEIISKNPNFLNLMNYNKKMNQINFVNNNYNFENQNYPNIITNNNNYHYSYNSHLNDILFNLPMHFNGNFSPSRNINFRGNNQKYNIKKNFPNYINNNNYIKNDLFQQNKNPSLNLIKTNQMRENNFFNPDNHTYNNSLMIKKRNFFRDYSSDYLFNRNRFNINKFITQNRMNSKRPIFILPQFKKRSYSQGRPFNLINKYYDENFILEEENEEETNIDEVKEKKIRNSVKEEKSKNYENILINEGKDSKDELNNFKNIKEKNINQLSEGNQKKFNNNFINCKEFELNQYKYYSDFKKINNEFINNNKNNFNIELNYNFANDNDILFLQKFSKNNFNNNYIYQNNLVYEKKNIHKKLIINNNSEKKGQIKDEFNNNSGDNNLKNIINKRNDNDIVELNKKKEKNMNYNQKIGKNEKYKIIKEEKKNKKDKNKGNNKLFQLKKESHKIKDNSEKIHSSKKIINADCTENFKKEIFQKKEKNIIQKNNVSNNNSQIFRYSNDKNKSQINDINKKIKEIILNKSEKSIKLKNFINQKLNLKTNNNNIIHSKNNLINNENDGKNRTEKYSNNLNNKNKIVKFNNNIKIIDLEFKKNNSNRSFKLKRNKSMERLYDNIFSKRNFNICDYQKIFNNCISKSNVLSKNLYNIRNKRRMNYTNQTINLSNNNKIRNIKYNSMKYKKEKKNILKNKILIDNPLRNLTNSNDNIFKAKNSNKFKLNLTAKKLNKINNFNITEDGYAKKYIQKTISKGITQMIKSKTQKNSFKNILPQKSFLNYPNFKSIKNDFINIKVKIRNNNVTTINEYPISRTLNNTRKDPRIKKIKNLKKINNINKNYFNSSKKLKLKRNKFKSLILNENDLNEYESDILSNKSNKKIDNDSYINKKYKYSILNKNKTEMKNKNKYIRNNKNNFDINELSSVTNITNKDNIDESIKKKDYEGVIKKNFIKKNFNSNRLSYEYK